ncbi:hypothetical protein JCM8208_000251 [Rhodotorula glutinis]
MPKEHQTGRLDRIEQGLCTVTERDYIMSRLFRDFEYDPTGHHLTSRAIEEYYKPLYPIAYESFVRTDTAGTPASMQVALGKDPWMLPGLGLRFFQQSDVDWVRKGEMRHIDGRQTLQTVYRLNLRPRANIAPHFAVQRAPLPPVVTTLAILIPTVYCGKKDEAEGALATRNALITANRLLVSHALGVPTAAVQYHHSIAHPRVMKEVAASPTAGSYFSQQFGRYNYVPLALTNSHMALSRIEITLSNLLRTRVPNNQNFMFVWPAVSLVPFSLESLALLAELYRVETKGQGTNVFWAFGVSEDIKPASWMLHKTDKSQLIVLSFREMIVLARGARASGHGWPLNEQNVVSYGMSQEMGRKIELLGDVLGEDRDEKTMSSRYRSLATSGLFPGHDLPVR